MARKAGSKNWTEAEKQRFRDAFAAGGIAMVQMEFLDRSESSLVSYAYKLGLKPKRVTRRSKKRAPVVFREKPKPSPYRVGPCDRGDREHIRRALDHFLLRVSLEVKRTPAMVRDALVEMARDRFRPDAHARIRVEPDAVYGDHVPMAASRRLEAV